MGEQFEGDGPPSLYQTMKFSANLAAFLCIEYSALARDIGYLRLILYVYKIKYMKNCTLSRVKIHIGISYLYSKLKSDAHSQCMMCYHIRDGHDSNLVLTLKYEDYPTNHGSCQSDYSRPPYMDSGYYIIHHILVYMFWSELFKSHKFEFYRRFDKLECLTLLS